LRGSLKTSLFKLQGRIGNKQPATREVHEEHISKRWKKLEWVEHELEELNGIDMGSTIGHYVNDLVLNGQINWQDEEKIDRALRAYFNFRPTGATTRTLKSLAFFFHLGSFYQMLTQFKDYGRIMYRAPARGLVETMKTLIPGVHAKYNLKDVWLEDIEADMRGFGKLLDAELRATGFRFADKYMKKLYMNAVMSKYEALAKKARHLKKGSTFRQRVERHMGKDAEQTIKDLAAGKKTELTVRLARGELLDLHPIALSEMTVAYLEGKDGVRLLYTMRNFGIKQLEYTRREIFRDMKTNRTRGTARLIWYALSLAVAGGSIEFLKDILKGKEPKEWPIYVVDEYMQLIFMSRFTAERMATEGPASAFGRNFMPPTGWFDRPFTDIGRGEVRESVKNIPIVGEPYYYWGGYGREKERKRVERESKKSIFD